MHITPRDFENLVLETMKQVMAALPGELSSKAAQVTIIAADRPARGDEDMVGLFEGVSLAERGAADNDPVADSITLFRVPLMNSCSSRKELREEIRITLLHELGHYFGFTENELEDRGL